MRLFSLVKKEYKQFLRSKVVVIFALYLFSVDIFVAGKGLGIKLKHAKFGLWDMCQSPSSRELISKMIAPYFEFSKHINSWKEFDGWIRRGDTVGVFVIPPEFERKISRRKKAKVLLALDGSLISTTVLSSAYTNSIVFDYNQWILRHRYHLPAMGSFPSVNAKWRIEFNSNLESSYFGGLSELFMNVTLMSMIISALSFVREKDYGTIEQILVSPAPFYEFVVSKVVFVLLTMLLFTLSSTIVVVHGILGIPLRGSLLLFALVTSLNVLSDVGIGLVVAGLSERISQVGLMVILFLVPIIFLSGGWVPPESMPSWLRPLTILSPLKYYMDLGLSVILKGSTFHEMWSEILKFSTLTVVLTSVGYITLIKRTAGV